MPVRLAVTEGPSAGTVFFIGEGESKVFGRSTTADVKISDPLMSRHHAMVRGLAQGGLVLDLDSSNGTFLNGRIVQEGTLATGDKVKIGHTVLEVTVEHKAGAAPGDKTPTVRALVFCSRCHRGVILGEHQPRPWEPFVCEDCKKAHGTLLDSEIMPGYRLVDRVGEDPRGPLYKAVQVGPPEREVLLRIFAPSEGTVDSRVLEHFLHEAMLAGRLAHPSIVETIDAGERSGIYFICEEWITGDDLATRLRRAGGPLPLERALGIAARVASALAYAYGQGIVHRNVRPGSIFVWDDGRVKLGDFGLAKMVSERTPSGVIRTGEWVGEANHLPPEQLVAAGTVDQRADVYALGANLYHMASGHAPYEAATCMRVIRRIGEGDLTPLAELAPDLPKPVCALVERCMERDPLRRFHDPAEVLQAIEEARSRLGFGA